MQDEVMKETSFLEVEKYILEKNYRKALQACYDGQLLEDAFYGEKLRQLPIENTNFYVYALVKQLKNVKEKDLESALVCCDQEFVKTEPRVQLMKVKILVRLGYFDEATKICNQFAGHEGFFLQKLRCLFQKKQYDEILELTSDTRYQKDFYVEEYRIKALIKKREFTTAMEEIKMSPVSNHAVIQFWNNTLQSYFSLYEVYQNTSEKKKDYFFQGLEDILVGEEASKEGNSQCLYYERVLLSSAYCDSVHEAKPKALLEEVATLFSLSLEEKRRLKKKQVSVDFVFYFQLLVRVSQKYQEVLEQVYSLTANGLIDEASSLVLLYKLDQDSPSLLESISGCTCFIKLLKEKR